MAFSSSNNHGCTTTPLPSLTGQGAYYIDITYWVDVDKARATQEKMKQEKLQAGSDSHLFDKLYVDNPWFSNLDFMALLEFTKQVILKEISCSLSKKIFFSANCYSY